MSIAPRKSRTAFAPVPCGIACRAVTVPIASAISSVTLGSFMNGRILAWFPALRCSHERQHSRRAAGGADMFGRADDDGGPRRRDDAEIGQQFDAVFARTQNREMCDERLSRARVEAQGVDA